MIGQVHLQMSIQHTDNVSQTQQNMNQRGVIGTSQASVATQKNVQKAQETVIPKDTLELSNYRYDAKEEGRNKYSRPEDKDKKKEQEDSEHQDDEFQQPRMNFNIQI